MWIPTKMSLLHSETPSIIDVRLNISYSLISHVLIQSSQAFVKRTYQLLLSARALDNLGLILLNTELMI